jgi:hypothetical protein
MKRYDITTSEWTNIQVNTWKKVVEIASQYPSIMVRDRKNPKVFDIITEFKNGAMVSQRIGYPSDTRRITDENRALIHKAFNIKDE